MNKKKIRAHSALNGLTQFEPIQQISSPFGGEPSPFGESTEPIRHYLSCFRNTFEPIRRVSSPFGSHTHLALNGLHVSLAAVGAKKNMNLCESIRRTDSCLKH